MTKRTKTGGRVQGTPNRLTKEARTLLKNVLFKELEQIPDYLDKLEPKDKIEVIIKLLPYVLPKVEAVEYDNNEPIDWSNLKIQLKDLDNINI